MAKRRLIALLVTGILAGLFVSACAGVASGTVDLGTGPEVLTGGPMFEMQWVPFLEVAQPAHSAQFSFEKAAIEETMQSEMQIQNNMLCSGAGH